MMSRRSKTTPDHHNITFDDDHGAKINKKIDWYTHPAIKWILQGCSFLSLVSVCFNTPQTFTNLSTYKLIYVTFAIDVLILIVFGIEMTIKIMRNGLIKPRIKARNAYLRDHWCRFEFSMVLFLFISVILQIVQIYYWQTFKRHYDQAWIGVLRSPRPLVFVRIFRILLNVKLPTARISQIIKRSSQQIYNVTLFFLFFMSFYGILGVQFFGALKYHCVRNGADLNNLTQADLAIPDTPCTPRNDSQYGYVCPNGMECRQINASYSVVGYSTFEHFPISFFSVYNAASQEGWSGVMYDAIDTLASWKAYIYFISLIFFLAWLVKNVFIAVIIETFAEIRVQFQQMWGSHDVSPETSSMILSNEQEGWKLVSLDESKPHGLAPLFLQRWVKSAYFKSIFMIIVLADAIVAACRVSHKDRRFDTTVQLDGIYFAQVGFTIIFDIELLLKLWVYGPKGYIQPSRHKFEAALAFFSTLNVVPELYRKWFTYAQVLRIVRLIKASPVLEEFCWKIFGPGKKLGSLVLFTMALLIITSGISLQLFCYIKDEDGDYHRQFSDFLKAFSSIFQILSNENWSEEMDSLMRSTQRDQENPIYSIFIACYFVIIHLFMTAAFMSMFQILLKKSWIDIMNGTLRNAGTGAPFAAIYFILFHLLVTVIILSLFVAVILDNLDLDEDLKRLKQLKAREISTAQQQNLPLRLRVFERFANQPQMVKVTKRIETDFDAPKVRESFMRSFVDSGSNDGNNSLRRRKPQLAVPKKELTDISLLTGNPAAKTSQPGQKRREISQLISESSEQRTMNSSDPIISKGMATVPTSKSLLSGNNQSNSALRTGKTRTNVNMRNPRMISMESANRQRNGTVPTLQSQSTTISNRNNAGGDDIDIQILQQKKQQAEIKRNQQESDLRENHPFFDTPLFIVGRESRFREICKTIVTARYPRVIIDPNTGKEHRSKYRKLARFMNIVPVLDWFMILITLFSCICMMFETPFNRVTDPNNSMKILVAAECVFVASMSIEMALKIFANGLFFTPNAIIRDVGGAMDTFIYFTSLLFLVTMVIINQERHSTIAYLSYGHVLLILRCMRPLRIFILVPHIRKVVYELVRGFKEIVLVFFLLFVLLFVFASYGVQVFGGKLRRCNDPEVRFNKTACKGLFFRQVRVTDMELPGEVKLMVPRVWANPYNFNFDDIFSAMLALFEVLSLEGWLEIRDILIDRIGPAESVYVHIFVFIGVLIGLTLFVGVVISNYSQNKGTALLTVDQRRWLDLKGRINLTQPLHVPPRPEKSPFREFIFDITQHRFFKRAVAVIVALNSLLLVLPWHTNIPHEREMPDYTQYLQGAAAAFVAVFVIEVLMKMVALTPKGYWYSRRNRIDLLVTSAGILWVVLHFSLVRHSGYTDQEAERQYEKNREFVDTLGYIVIILRFFTITGKHATLKMLMLTIVESMWKSFFLITGMFLLMLFYAYAGVLMFGMTRYGDHLNRHANFRTAGQAIVLLFRIVTGEDWNKIMHDCMINKPLCFGGRNYWETDCGNAALSVIYFCSFYIIITYIMLNLLVAIIMENFSLFYSNEEDALLSYSDIRMYQNTWNAIDLARRGVIPNRRVPFMLRLLKGRLEIDHENLPTKMLFKHMCYEIQYLHGGPSGEATFHDVLTMLSYRSVDIRKSLQLEELLAREDLEMTVAEDVAKMIISDWLTGCVKRMRSKEHVSRKPTQEPFYVVTEAEETPLVEAEFVESPTDTTFDGTNPLKQKITRNISEPLVGLQLPKKISATMSDSQMKERLKKNSLSSRSKLSEGMSDSVAKEKSQNVDQWWKEQIGM